MNLEKNLKLYFILVFVLLFSSCSTTNSIKTKEENTDILESINRPIFYFNDWLYTNILKPTTNFYTGYTPNFIQSGVENFFGNIKDFTNIINGLLQFNPEIFGINLFRVFVNTTFGIFGLFDVASYLQSGKSDTSFSLTLNKYGVGSGPYIVIPFIGSTDLRSLASIPINWKIYPQNENAVFSFYQDETLYYSLYGLNILNSTVPLIKSEGAIVGDRYDFVRDSYLQHRNFLENDGQTNHDSMDDDEDDEDDEEF